jgi:DNA topoisomerase-3
VKENYRRFTCERCAFSISKTPGGRQFEIEEVEALLRERTLGPLQGFRSKKGLPFAAILRIVFDEELKNFKLEFDFGQDQSDQPVQVDFSGQQPLGPCPKCGAAVYEQGMSYTCENTPLKKCDFRSGKVILRQEITPQQMQKLLAEGKTDLLEGFVSNRNGRKFKAYLAKQSDGKIGFEFAPRPAKAPGKAAAKTKEKAAPKKAPAKARKASAS